MFGFKQETHKIPNIFLSIVTVLKQDKKYQKNLWFETDEIKQKRKSKKNVLVENLKTKKNVKKM